MNSTGLNPKRCVDKPFGIKTNAFYGWRESLCTFFTKFSQADDPKFQPFARKKPKNSPHTPRSYFVIEASSLVHTIPIPFVKNLEGVEGTDIRPDQKLPGCYLVLFQPHQFPQLCSDMGMSKQITLYKFLYHTIHTNFPEDENEDKDLGKKLSSFLQKTYSFVLLLIAQSNHDQVGESKLEKPKFLHHIVGYNLFSTATPLDSSGNVPEPRYKHGIPHWLGTSFSSYERDWFIASIGPRNCSNREEAKNESPFLGLGVGTLMLACMQQMLFCQTYKQPSRTPIIYCPQPMGNTMIVT